VQGFVVAQDFLRGAGLSSWRRTLVLRGGHHEDHQFDESDPRGGRSPAAIVQADAVRLITERKGRPIGKGALWGLGIGAAAGLALGIAVVAGCDDGDECAGAILGLGAFFGGIGAGTGAAIGALIPGKTLVVYRAPGAAGATSARFSLAPIITPARKGVAVSVRF
jgi:hypothetical protein